MVKKIYIAGKLNDIAADYIKNVHKMIVWGEKVRKLGFSVYIPAIDFLMGAVCGDYVYDDYFDNSQPWLAVSDAVFLVPGWIKSKGTCREINTANKLDIPIFESLEALKEWGNK